MQILALKACHQQSAEIREHLVFRGFCKGIENIQVGINLRKNLGDADMALDKALGRALHIEAVTRIEEQDSEQQFSPINSNEKSQLINSIFDLLRTLQSKKSNRQVNQIFSLQRARPKEYLRGSERDSRGTGDRNKNYNSYGNSADNRRTKYDSRTQSPTPGGINGYRYAFHESCAKKSKL